MTLLIRPLFAVGCMIFTFTSLRLFSVQFFDIACFLCIVLFALTSPDKMARILYKSQDLALFAFFMLLAIGVSAFATSDVSGHLDRSFRMLSQLLLLWLFVRVAFDGVGFTTRQLLDLTLISCTVCCFSIILAGQFGLFGGAGREAWQRLTGLAEHPIEAGYLSAFGVLIAIDTMIRHKFRWRYLVAAAVCAYSARYSVSISAVASLAVGLLLLLVVHRRTGLAAILVCVAVVWAQYEAATGSLLFSRLSAAAGDGANYTTLATRIAQNELALSRIDEITLLIGKSFSALTLPFGQEVHNTLVASVYHFGILGLVGTLVLWRKLFIASMQWQRSSYIALMLGLMVVFLVMSLTGPSMARRTLWFPLAIVALAQLRRTSSDGTVPDQGDVRVAGAVSNTE